VAQARQVAVGAREGGERRRDPRAARGHQVGSLPQHDEVGVVGDEAGGRPQVEERPGLRRHLGEGADVRHDFVAVLALDLRRAGKLSLGRLEVALELGDRLGRDPHAEVALGTHQLQPQATPEAEPHRGRKEAPHRPRGVAARERVNEFIHGHRTIMPREAGQESEVVRHARPDQRPGRAHGFHRP
jgi:hypothetical protein